jgi:Ran GTPase-activating protein (RanGAP) involved in mRNA processing and transport
MQSSFLITEVVDTELDPYEDLDDDISCVSGNISLDGTIDTSNGSVIEVKNYFGQKARDGFGKRSRWLARQRKLLRKGADLNDKTMFETSLQEDDHSDCTLSDDDNTLDGFDSNSVSEDVDVGTMTSPRTKYIAKCLNGNMNPRMSLIVRKRVSPHLNLQHLGMGDSLGTLFAEALRDLPYVDSINISDNNLCDKSLGPIITAIINLPTVTHLDISNNNLDKKSASALADYLHTPGCPLRRLVLKSSDIGDSECHKFVAALAGNTDLEDLDLSNNIIGQTETLNILQPDLITGGEALAELLATNSCGLKTLTLAWNMIRLDGAIALSDCLVVNTHLTHLDMSYNTLGKEGGEHLGNALLQNRSLKTLLLVNNGINFSACFAICVGIEENYSLRTVNMDSNPIGEGGARAFMQIPFTAGTVFVILVIS